MATSKKKLANATPRKSSISVHMSGNEPTYTNLGETGVAVLEVLLATPESKARDGLDSFYFQGYVVTRAADGQRLLVLESDLYGVNVILGDQFDIPAYHFRDGRVQCFMMRSVATNDLPTSGQIMHMLKQLTTSLVTVCDEYYRSVR